MKEHPIDSYFRNNLEQHTLPVSDAIWGKIAADLPKKKNRLPLYYSIAAASVAILLAIIFWPYPQQQYLPVVNTPAQEWPFEPTALEAAVQKMVNEKSAVANNPVKPPKAKIAGSIKTKSLEPAALDVVAFEASLQAIEKNLVEWADSNTASQRNIVVFVELAKPKVPALLTEPELPVIENQLDQNFNLRDYSTTQLNNLIHGAPLESPFKGTQTLIDNPSIGKITKFFKSQFE